MGRNSKHVPTGNPSTCSVARRSRLAVAVLSAATIISAASCQATYAVACANETLRSSLGSNMLADCRAYETVTPIYKAGYPLVLRSLASNGEEMVLASFGGFADLPGSGEGLEDNFYLDTRSAHGWRLSSMMAPLHEFVGQEPVVGAAEANDDMSLWYGHTPQQSAKMNELYVRSASGEYKRVGTLSPAVASLEGEESDVLESTSELFDSTIAATSAYQHVVLLANHPGQDYWSFDKTIGGRSLYEYSSTANKRPVLVAATGEKPTGGQYHEELLADCGSELGSGTSLGSSYNALSADGETIFFTLYPCEPAPKATEIYTRTHGSVSSPARAETVNVSENECTVACGGVSSKNFEGASENGEKAFFTSTQKLTNDASDLTASGNAYEEERGCPSSEEGCNLYEYDFAQPAHRRLTLIAGGANNVRGVVGIAADGSRVYFVADGAILGAGENEFDHRAVSGQPNLYVYDTDAGTTAFITTLSQQDEADWARQFLRPVEVAGEGGSFLLFASSAPAVTPDESSKSGFAQLFEYDSETRELVRITQGEQVPGTHGEGDWNEDGNGVTVGIEPVKIALVAESLGKQNDFKSTTNRLNISKDGKTVVFETAGELSPLAGPSSRLGCASVYEFRSEGPISAGAVHLLSDGRDVPIHKNEACGAEFIGMDESGNNILFATSDALLSSDVDSGQRDIYDARVGGGFSPNPIGGESATCVPGACEGSVPGSAGLPDATPSDAGGNAGTTGTFGLGTGSKQAKKSNGRSSKRHSKSVGAHQICRHRSKRQRTACKAAVRHQYASKGKSKKSRRGS